ncbi:MAG TPA: J domain-containing protein [Candidatus Limnocylindrales bacterium]|nr:J domain-containing protein [Candidatus Limnocylindrales bacterium]
MGRGGHYATLELQPGAGQREIRAAYRRLARATHPDGHPGDPALERRFKRIARAYEVLSDPQRRRAYDERLTRGRFASPGRAGRATYAVDAGPVYHSDLGHHSDFYQAGDPLTVGDAARLVRRDAGWLRRAIRGGRLRASRGATGYLLRRRDVERLDRSARRRGRGLTVADPNHMDTSES